MGVNYKDYYKVLDVERSATKEDIAKAFKKLARKYHPDLNPGDKGAEDSFKEINEAYEVLKDEEKRKMYDQLGPNWQDGQQFNGFNGQNFGSFNFSGSQGFGGGDFSDFFETLFGQSRGGAQPGFGADPFGGRRQNRRGRDIEAELTLSLEEVTRGGEKSITLNSAGSDQSLKVNIPAGMKEGAKLRLAGKGHAGTPAGDLYLIIHLAHHPKFQVEGDNLVCDVQLSPWQAVLGDTVRVPTLEGEVSLDIPPGSSSGRKMRLRGKGLGQSGKRGDLMVRIAIIAPKLDDLSPKQKELWQALAQEG